MNYIKTKNLETIQNPNSDFYFKGQKIDLYLSLCNCGINLNYRLTERALELALAKEWLKNKEQYTEIGAVTPYYPDIYTPHDVIDPVDIHDLVNIKKSMFEIDFSRKNVLFISTIEHIGKDDYGLIQKETATDALKKITKEAKSCFVTFPLGYNEILDKYINEIYNNDNPFEIIIYSRSEYKNDWKISETKPQYTYGPLWANDVCIVIK